MTLKEKFDKISCRDCDMPYCDIKCTILSDYELTNLEQIANEFAIGFAEWVEYQPKYKKIKKSGLDNSYMKMTTKELLEIYKNEKGL